MDLVIKRSLVDKVGSIEGAIIIDFFEKENAKPSHQEEFCISINSLASKLDLPISISTLRRTLSKLINLGYLYVEKSKKDKNKLYYHFIKKNYISQAKDVGSVEVKQENFEQYSDEYLVKNIKQNIGYKKILLKYKKCKVDVVLNILKAVEISNNKFIRVNSQNIPRYKVLTVLLRINMEDVINVLERYKYAYKNIRNEHNYLLTALYNQVIARLSSEDRYGYTY